jgi:hypothetical protein
MTSLGRVGLALGIVAAGLASAAPARGFVENCHQGITSEALDQGGWPLGLSPPPLTGDDRYLVQEVPFYVPERARNPWALAALMGNQFTDQGSVRGNDLVALAELAARPELQREHCLRSPGDDGPDGDRQALAACKAFILEQVQQALGPDSAPDLQRRETVRMTLVFRGKVNIPVNQYGFHLGRALHALQDSFTHTFREPDGGHKVRTVLNWVEWLHGGSSYNEARDGFQHVTPLDNCNVEAVGGLERRATALEASSELAAALADDSGAREGRLARAEQVIDRWFLQQTGCTAENGWCDAPERNLKTGYGCATVPGRPRPLGLLWLVAVGLLFGRLLRRSTAVTGLAVALAIPWLFGAAVARAEEIKGDVIKKATPEEQRELESKPLGIILRGGLAIDNAAANAGVGVRWDLNKYFTVGVDAEYNPWISLEERRTANGTTNIYAVGLWRLNIRDYLELHAKLGAGMSIMMFDTFAAKQGSIGPFASVSPLGVAFRMGARWRFLVDPGELVFAVPQLKGIPLVYRQHRFSIGLQANF